MDHLKLAPVTILPVVTTLDTDAERVLSAAQGNLQTVIVVGYDHDGEFYFASNKSDGPEVLWALEQAKLKLLSISS